ncbi:MAG: HEPN domain-containing protein [Bacteroidetes bacterium]|nr:HEPN domain-containing protein [Bacteroidota bacterium]
MNPEKADYIRNWLFKANEDIAVIKQLASETPELFTGAICYHAQQAVEKYFKAFLVFHDIDFKKVHDLDYLLTLCIGIDRSDLEQIKLESLNDYGVSVRYPDDFFIFLFAEAMKYKALAEEIQSIILKKVTL